MNGRLRSRESKIERGMSLLEVLVAAALLMFGAVAAMQVVPVAIQSNLNSRFESTAVVQAQQELDQMISQPMTVNSFVDDEGNTVNLGDPTQPNTIVGNPVKLVGGAQQTLQIDFSAAAVSGYSLTRGQPNDPMKPQYDIRWAVVTTVDAGAAAIGRRYIVGVWKTNARQYSPPVTLDDQEYKYKLP